MIRKLICSVALVAIASAYALAIERATFILSDGGRKSGTVVFHTESRENLINNYLNLGTDDGKEMTFPVDQVAVIDFVGGQPPAEELRQIPQDSTHLLVLRDGSAQRGRMLNLVGGDTLRWQNEAGQSQQYALRDVRRLYLNPTIARTVFNVQTSPKVPEAVATTGTVVEPGAVRIDANQPWSNAGMFVRRGDRVAFHTTGQINFGQSPGQTAGPDGNAAVTNSNYPVPAMPVGGLIGRVGDGVPFPIGSNSQPIVMPANGILLLGINDSEIGDNSGFFSVVATKIR